MTRSYTIREVEQLLAEDMAPKHRELMQFMLDELRVHNNRAWAAGVQACVDIVKQRHTHYELYRCSCKFVDAPCEEHPLSSRACERGTASCIISHTHAQGCKAEMMSTHPATFAVLDEVYTFLSALLSRGPKL